MVAVPPLVINLSAQRTWNVQTTHPKTHISYIIQIVTYFFTVTDFGWLPGKKSINTLLIKLLNKRRKWRTTPIERHLFDDIKV